MKNCIQGLIILGVEMAFFLLCISIFIMFLQPTAIFPWLEPYQPLRNSAILALVAYIFCGKKSNVSFFKNKINILFLLFIVTQIVSAAQIWLTGAWEIFNSWLKMGIIYFLIVKSVTNEKKVIFLTLSIVLGICYLSYYSISNFVVHYIPGIRVGGFGWYEGSNDLSIILVSVIPLALLIANSIRSTILRYLFILLAGVLAFNVLFTGSRNGLLGLFIVGTISLLFFKKVPVFLKFMLMGIFLFAIITVGFTNILHRSDLSTGFIGDSSSEDRLDQWKTGLHMLRQKPLLGIGPGEFASRAADYGGIRGLAPHNTLIQVFAETGLLGGIVFSLFSFLPLFELRQLKEKNVNAVNIYKFLFSALTGFWVCAFFSNRYEFYILYVLVALLVAVRSNLIKEDAL